MKDKKNIGLYFGTFNPIHVGHLIIANHIVNYSNLDELYLVISPQNPLKEQESLLEDYHRLNLVKIAIEDNPKLKVSDIEFSLTKPSYTSLTLSHLQEKYPNNHFSLIMGEDNLRSFHKWKNHEDILMKHKIIVYPRSLLDYEKPNVFKNKLDKHSQVSFCNAPIMNISSSFIRNAIKENKDVSYMLTKPVAKYIEEMHFYKTS